MFRSILSLLIVIQLIFSVQFSYFTKTYADDEKSKNTDITDIMRFEQLAPKDTQALSDHLDSINRTAELIANRQFNQTPIEIFDSRSLLSQSTEIFLENGDIESFGTKDLNKPVPKVVFNRVEIKVINGELVIDGFLGGKEFPANNNKLDKGKHVARHKLQPHNQEIISATTDKKLITAVSKRGDVFVVSKEYVMANAFKGAPIPLTKIYDASKEIALNYGEMQKGTELVVTYLTRGLKPFIEREISKTVLNKHQPLIPRNGKGQPIYTMGDIVIYKKFQDGSRELIGSLPRELAFTSLEKSELGLALTILSLSMEGMGENLMDKIWNKIGTESDIVVNPMKELIELLANQTKRQAAERVREQILDLKFENPLILELFKRLDRKDLVSAINRVKALQSEASSKAEKDAVSLDQWLASFDNIKEQAEKTLVELNLRSREAHNSENLKNITEDKEMLKRGIESNDFRESYRALLSNALSQQIGFTEVQGKLLQKVKNFLTAPGLRKMAAWLGGLAGLGTAGYVTTTNFPGLAEHMYSISNWIITDFMPATLRSETYRNPTLLGMTALLGIIPFTMFLAYISVPLQASIKNMIAPLAHKSSKILALHRKLSQNVETYKDVGIWPRIVTFNMRVYSHLMLPFYHSIAKVLRQNTIDVLRTGTNPLKPIWADSRIGRKIGIQEKTGKTLIFPGFTSLSPFQSKNEKINLKAVKDRAHKELVHEKNKARTLSWILGAFAVAGSTQLGPNFLLEAQTKGLELAAIEKMAQPEFKQNWLLTSGEINSVLLDLLKDKSSLQRAVEKINIDLVQDAYRASQLAIKRAKEAFGTEVFELGKEFDLKNIDQATMAQLEEISNKLAKKITHLNSAQKGFLRARQASRNIFTDSAKSMANFGLEDSERLKRSVANKFVGSQTGKEFRSDHVLIIGMGGTVGKRADISMPMDLAHRPGEFLWTTPAHLADVANNYLLHMFQAGPNNALNVQAQQKELERNYNNIENIAITANQRSRGPVADTFFWYKNLLTTKSSNIGGYYNKGFIKRAVTAQAALTFSVIIRTFVPELSGKVDLILISTLLGWIARDVYYGWPWMPIVRGNQVSGEVAQAKKEKLEGILSRISKAARHHNKESLSTASQELAEVYMGEGFTAQEPLLYELQKAVKAHPGKKLALKTGNIRNAIRNGDIVTFATLTAYIEAVNSRNYEKADQIFEYVVTVITADPTSKEYQSLREKVNSFAIDFANHARRSSPVYNQFNSKVEWFNVFAYGAVGTTYMAFPLLVKLLNPAHGFLTWQNVGLYSFYQAVFLASTYFFLSKNTAESIWIPLGEKIGKFANKLPLVKPTKRFGKKTWQKVQPIVCKNIW